MRVVHDPCCAVRAAQNLGPQMPRGSPTPTRVDLPPRAVRVGQIPSWHSRKHIPVERSDVHSAFMMRGPARPPVSRRVPDRVLARSDEFLSHFHSQAHSKMKPYPRRPSLLPEHPIAHASIVGLLVECPLHHGNPEHCQLHALRKLSMMDRFSWSLKVTADEAFRIMNCCSGCLRAGR